MENFMGVYIIRNKINNKIYVGSSVDIYKRWKAHKGMLEENRHDNNYLRNAWSKYGENNFEFIIIEVVFDKNQLIIQEQFYIDYFQSYNRKYGYNIRVIAENNWGIKLNKKTKRKISISNKGKKLTNEHKQKLSMAGKGRKHTEYTKQKMSTSQKGSNHPMYGKHHTEESKQKISTANKGSNNPFYGKHHTEYAREKLSNAQKGKKLTEEHKQNISTAMSIDWEVISPNGNIIMVHNLNKFCRENNLDNGNMVNVSKGKHKHHKGYKCKKLEKTKELYGLSTENPQQSN